MEANLCYSPPFRLGLFDLSLSMSFSFFSSFSSFFPIIINIINISIINISSIICIVLPLSCP